MSRIVVTEFMDERAVAKLAARHDVLYDAALVDDAPRLARMRGAGDAVGFGKRLVAHGRAARTRAATSS